MAEFHLKQALAPAHPAPARRRLRAYAYDPVMSGRIDGWGLNEAALDLRWEDDLAPGPVGEYLEVVDVDPASNCAYAPVDLNDPRLLATDGLGPNEDDPQFHQQMVYAVSMKTIEHFERALGRVALWAPQMVDGAETFVRRLRLYPHALREENAYYSPERSALLFGYFQARARDTGEVLPGGRVYACLSHDIVAHETTHALLDGLHRYFREPTNPDALAFHEAFADIVALFQHFTVPEALRAEVARTRGDLRNQNLLSQLAVQFGQSTGRHGALRDAIGRFVDGVWTPTVPDPNDYAAADEPHDRGAILVAAVFDAFLQVYAARSADLVRLATQGTGVLPPGDIPVDLVNRLAQEAATVAGEVLQMCIRALDYCPPVDLNFGDYLRAMITADKDVCADSQREHRVAMIAAFRARGIYPDGVRQLSVGAVAWEPPPIPLKGLEDVLGRLDATAKLKWSLYADREAVWNNSRAAARALHDALIDSDQVLDLEIATLGLVRKAGPMALGGQAGKCGGMEVHSVRPARRIDSDGQARTDLVIEVAQTWRSTAGRQKVRGGCTLLFDLETQRIRYLVRKRLDSAQRVGAQLAFQAAPAADSLWSAYYGADTPRAEPFAALHRNL